MNGQPDRRLYYLLALMASAVMLRYTLFSGGGAPAVVTPVDSIPQAERRLERLRQQAAMVPAKEAMLKQAQAELDLREKGVIQAATAAQAQAHLLDTVHRVASLAGFDARGADQLSEVRALGNDYGLVSVTESFTCGIEQLVNFLAQLHTEPEIVGTNDIHISGGTDKQKNIQVRLSVSGVVSKNLAPKKGRGI